MIDKKTKDDTLLRLKKIEGQVKGLERMISEGRYCIDIVNQVTAIARALEKVGLVIMGRHIESCVAEAIRENKPENKVTELIETINKFIK